jgi:hypothetical protein
VRACYPSSLLFDRLLHLQRRTPLCICNYWDARDDSNGLNICLSWGCSIPQEDVDKAFAIGKLFQELPEDVKEQWPFNPDTYLGHRGSAELETVTGMFL